MTHALLLLLLAQSVSAESGGAVRHARGGYKECVGTVQGHAQPGAEIRVCLDGNGTYNELERVTAALTGHDWFPASRFPKIAGEVRLVCGVAAQARLAVVLPAQGETGSQVRVELPCSLGARAAGRAMHVARNLILLALHDQAGFARRATAHAGGCGGTARSDACARFEKLVLDVASGKGSPMVNGRPFGFLLGGFEFRAGLAAAPAKPAVGLESADPVTRLRGLLGARDELDDREWRDRVAGAFDKMPREIQLKLINEMFDSPDSNARNWAMDNISLLPEARRNEVAARMLDDSDQEVRSKAIPYALALGDAYINKAIHDPDAANRMLAFDFVTTADIAPASGRSPAMSSADIIRYLQSGLTDADEAIREMAQGRLNFLLQQQEYIRAGRPGWEDGKGVHEAAPAPGTH